MTPCHVAIAHDARGPNNSIVMAEVSGLLAVAEAMRIIERWQADMMIAGGASAMRIHPTSLIFHGEALLSRRNDDPAAACRPFDADRDGMVNGEGAAAFILESRQHAERRGAGLWPEFSVIRAAMSRGPPERLSAEAGSANQSVRRWRPRSFSPPTSAMSTRMVSARSNTIGPRRMEFTKRSVMCPSRAEKLLRQSRSRDRRGRIGRQPTRDRPRPDSGYAELRPSRSRMPDQYRSHIAANLCEADSAGAQSNGLRPSGGAHVGRAVSWSPAFKLPRSVVFHFRESTDFRRAKRTDRLKPNGTRISLMVFAGIVCGLFRARQLHRRVWFGGSFAFSWFVAIGTVSHTMLSNSGGKEGRTQSLQSFWIAGSNELVESIEQLQTTPLKLTSRGLRSCSVAAAHMTLRSRL